MNKVILSGFVGKDVEVHNGTITVARFSIATNESYKNKEGQIVTETEWHNIKCFGKLAEICAKIVKGGTAFEIEGKLKTESYENKQGVKVYSTFIIADSVKYCPAKKTENKLANEPITTNDVQANYPEVNDDDLPF